MEDSQEIGRIAAFLARPGNSNASAAEIAEVVFGTCEAIDAALAPVIGVRGVEALLRRSLHLAARGHPWLTGALSDDAASHDCALLKIRLSQQTSADAVIGGAVFLQTFYDLLSSLVGASLTERLLRSVWIDFMGAPPAQET